MIGGGLVVASIQTLPVTYSQGSEAKRPIHEIESKIYCALVLG